MNVWQIYKQVHQTGPDSWHLPVGLGLSLLAVALAYFRGYRRIRLTRLELYPAWRLYCFFGGLAALWTAAASPFVELDDILLVVHMVQHLVFMSVVPLLLLLGAPVVPLLRGLPRRLVRDGLGPLFHWRWLRRVLRLLTHPVFAWLAMNISYLGWHVPWAYELALRSDGWHALEHACFLFTSLLFWFPVVRPWPGVSRGSRWGILPYLVAADIVNTALSAFLVFSGRVLYPSYAAAAQVFGISAMRDQVAAGALMWVAGSVFYLVPLVFITMRLLSPSSGRLVYVSK